MMYYINRCVITCYNRSQHCFGQNLSNCIAECFDKYSVERIHDKVHIHTFRHTQTCTYTLQYSIVMQHSTQKRSTSFREQTLYLNVCRQVRVRVWSYVGLFICIYVCVCACVMCVRLCVLPGGMCMSKLLYLLISFVVPQIESFARLLCYKMLFLS